VQRGPTTRNHDHRERKEAVRKRTGKGELARKGKKKKKAK